jgi:ribonucleoside-diphosphate reductase alpha chain
MDYIFRRLALDFLPYDTRAELGIFTAKERAAQIQAEAVAEAAAVDLAGMAASAPVSAPVGAATAPAATAPAAEKEAAPAAGSSTELLEIVLGTSADAPLCFTCGTKMRPAGSCYVCEGCGSTSGCS